MSGGGLSGGGLALAVARMGSGWNRFWYEPVPASAYALVRVLFGTVVLILALAMAGDLMTFFTAEGIVGPADHAPALDGSWSLLGLVDEPAAVVALWSAMVLSAVAVIAGLRPQVASLVILLILLTLHRRNPLVFNSGDVVVRLIALFMVFAPSSAAFSVDRLLRARAHFWEIPLVRRWPLRLLQIQLCVIYLVSVMDKLGGTTWLDGTAVHYAMRVEDLHRFAVVIDWPLLVAAATYGTLVLELALGTVIWNRRLRPWLLIAGAAFHLWLTITMRLGPFTWAMLVLYLAFVPDTASERVLRGLRALSAQVRAAQWPSRAHTAVRVPR